MATNRSVQRLRARLAKIPIEVRAAAATEALLQAQALGQAIQRAAPIDEGALKESVRVESGRHGDRFYVKAGGQKTTRRVRKGQSATYDYANAVEFGTKKKPPRPFFYPTYRASKASIKSGMTATIRKAVKRSFGRE